MDTNAAPQAQQPAAPQTPQAPPVQQPAAPPPSSRVVPPWEGASNSTWAINGTPWYETTPEDKVREWAAKKGYKTPHEALLGHYNLERAFNNAGDVITLPAGTDDDKAWDAFYDKKGRPKTPDEYDFEHPDKDAFDPAFADFGKKLFHKLGLNKAEAKKGVAEWQAFVTEYNTKAQAAAAEQQAKVQQEQIAELQKKWGHDFARNQAAGVRAVQALGLTPDALSALEKQMGFPVVVELMTKLGSMAQEGRLVGNAGGGGDDLANLNAEQLMVKANQFRTANYEALTNGNHPDHASKLKELERLYTAMQGRS